MYKTVLKTIAGIFLFFYLLNCLMPMSFGDDYLYAFIWQGKPMFVPLTENAVKINSWKGLLESQLSFYFSWSGRITNNTLAQVFAWTGKPVFDVCNAIVATLLVLEIYWCVHRGKVSFNFKPGLLCCVFFMLWVFTPQFPSVYFWLVGACHYLWPAFLLFGFLIPYIHKYYYFEKTTALKTKYNYIFFFFGVIAGCTNENSICWIILVLLLFIYHGHKNEKENETWMYTGLLGLATGYVLLMFAPGNYARLLSVHGTDWFGKKVFLDSLYSFIQILVLQFILWYFCLRSLLKMDCVMKDCEESVRNNLQKDVLLIKVFCITAIGMSAIMLFSPEFHLRSGFPGTVQLIVAVGILLRIQKEYGIELLQQNVRKFLTYVGIICFVISAGVTLHFLYEHCLWNTNLMSKVTALQMSNEDKTTVLCVKSFKKTNKIEDFLSGYHTFENSLSKDENSWENVAFSQYYGIKGIRMVEEELNAVSLDGKIKNEKE